MDQEPASQLQDCIEVGESGNTYRFYLTKLALEQEKENAKELEAGLQRLKTRATSLMGWCISLSSLAATGFFTTHEYKISLLVASVCFVVAGLQCIRVMYSTPWKTPHFSLDWLTSLQKNSELEIMEAMMFSLKKFNGENAETYLLLQTHMKQAWLLFGLTPILSFVAALTEYFLHHSP